MFSSTPPSAPWVLPAPTASNSKCADSSHPNNSGFPPLVVPLGLGVVFHIRKGPENDPEDIALMAEAGFGFVREDIRWEIVETIKGQYDFSSADWEMELLSRAGIRPFLTLNYSNLLYESDLRSVQTEQGRQAFAAFAAAAAKRYAGRGVVWEIWNEPNNANFWRPEPNVDEYYALVVETVEAIRRADPRAIIVAPATGLDWAYLEALFQRGMLRYIDGVSVHPYRALNPPETVVADYDKLRDLIARYAPPEKSISVVSSEWGYSSVTHNLQIVEDLQARYLARQFLVNLWQDIPIQMWFTWRKPDEPETPRKAIVTPDRTPTKAYHAAKTLINTLNGYRFLQRLPGETEQDYILLFSNCQQYALAVWTAPESVNLGDPMQHQVVLPLQAGRGAIISMLGYKRGVTWNDNGLEIVLSEEPQYILLDSLNR